MYCRRLRISTDNETSACVTVSDSCISNYHISLLAVTSSGASISPVTDGIVGLVMQNCDSDSILGKNAISVLILQIATALKISDLYSTQAHNTYSIHSVYAPEMVSLSRMR